MDQHAPVYTSMVHRPCMRNINIDDLYVEAVYNRRGVDELAELYNVELRIILLTVSRLNASDSWFR